MPPKHDPAELLHAVVASAPIVLFAFDADGTFTLSEGRGLDALGLKPGQSVGRSVFELYADNPVVIDCCRRALKGESLTAIVPVGPITFETRYFPQLDWGGKVVGVVGIATDVSETYRSAMAKDELLSTICHELRTPLASASGWTALMKEGNLNAAEARKALETTVRNLGEIKGMIAQLRDATLVSTGKLTLKLKTCDLASAVREAAKALASAAEAKNVSVRIDAPALKASVDKARVRQIAWNLLSNAVKFSHKGGTVEARLFKEGADAVLVVSDRGPGLHPELIGQVFDLPRSPITDAPPRARGLGLGLAVSRRLAELHGGSLSADSEPGRGASFTLRMPLRAPSSRRKG